MFYLDTSVAVSAISSEPSTGAVLEWLAVDRDLLMSDWLMTEAAAALSQKRRMGMISAGEHSKASEALRHQIGGASSLIPVARENFRLAARFAEQAETGLRAGDALHLAIASTAGATIVTLDKGQARAGAFLHVETLLL
jgi:predicted nucleic acid-binding protein